jgi:hypothetical protein
MYQVVKQRRWQSRSNHSNKAIISIVQRHAWHALSSCQHIPPKNALGPGFVGEIWAWSGAERGMSTVFIVDDQSDGVRWQIYNSPHRYTYVDFTC